MLNVTHTLEHNPATPAISSMSPKCIGSVICWQRLATTTFHCSKIKEDVFEQKTVAACRHLQLETDKAVQDAKDIQAHLTAVNKKMAHLAMTNSNELLGQITVAAVAPII